MKNIHLVPVNVTQLVEQLTVKNIRENEKNNYMLRLEAIRDYCNESLNKLNTKQNMRSYK
jgi:hypothetical protein